MISEEHLEPHVRLFLSVDVIGSTAYKQQWISAEDNESWIVFFESFFNEFHGKFRYEIAKAFKKEARKEANPPAPWKLLGDEIVYAIKLDKGWEVLFYVTAFKEAVIAHRDEIEKSGRPVSLKATAWLAGFPVGNSVIKTPMGEDDFIGPLIDTGFRLSKFASRERMVLSVDLAWYLTKGASGLINVFIDDLESLKGVLGGKPYPIIWWSMDSDLSFSMKDVGLINDVGALTLNKYCNLYISRAPKPLIHPFFIKDGDEMPENYAKELENVCKLRNGLPDDHPKDNYPKNEGVINPRQEEALVTRKISIESLIDTAMIKPSSVESGENTPVSDVQKKS